jgi:hypothetical protein
MNRNTKIALGILGGILVICFCLGIGGLIALGSFGRFVARTIKTDPTEIARTAENIAQFTPPAGYKVNAMSIFGLDTIMVVPPNPGNPIFMLIKYPTSGYFDSDLFQSQIERSIGQQYFGRGITFRNIGQTTAYFRGQKVNLMILEGTTNSGKTIIEEIGAFRGNNGPVFLTILGERDSWNQTTIDAFLNSIR